MKKGGSADEEAGVGLGQFEPLLRVFNLKCEVSPDVRRALCELQQIRHCFAHRRGRADGRLLERLGELQITIDATPGEPIEVGQDQFKRYAVMVTDYLEALFDHAMERAGGYRLALEEAQRDLEANAEPVDADD